MYRDLCRWRSTRVPNDKRIKMVQDEVTLAEVTSFVIVKGTRRQVCRDLEEKSLELASIYSICTKGE